MLRLQVLLAFVLCMLSACRPVDDLPTVQLVPAEALADVFPVAIDSFTTQSDTTYRGYWETERGLAALQIVARAYTTPGGHTITLNFATFNDREQFMSMYREGAVRDSSADRETYDILLGRLVMVGQGRAVEARGFDPAILKAALNQVNYPRLEGLPTAALRLDSTFVKQGD